MKRTALPLVLAMIPAVLMLFPPALTAGEASPLDENAFIAVADKVNPSVVTLKVQKAVEFDASSSELFRRSSGSGFIIDAEGHILTNKHVMIGATEAAVGLSDGREFEAVLVNAHPKMDVALIKLKTPPKGLVPAELGDSDALKAGQWVAAIGAPFGFSNTITKGIVSAVNRPAEFFLEAGGVPPSHTLIQTDASINPGNSGGPLVNLKGEVVGVNTLIFSPGRSGSVGLGFAIPINAVKDVLPKLKSPDKPVLGWIGAGVQKIDDDLRFMLSLPPGMDGLIVSKITKGGPADTAGVRELDIVLAVGKNKFGAPLPFERFIQNQPEGKELTLKLWRRGKELKLRLRVGAQK